MPHDFWGWVRHPELQVVISSWACELIILEKIQERSSCFIWHRVNVYQYLLLISILLFRKVDSDARELCVCLMQSYVVPYHDSPNSSLLITLLSNPSGYSMLGLFPTSADGLPCGNTDRKYLGFYSLEIFQKRFAYKNLNCHYFCSCSYSSRKLIPKKIKTHAVICCERHWGDKHESYFSTWMVY